MTGRKAETKGVKHHHVKPLNKHSAHVLHVFTTFSSVLWLHHGNPTARFIPALLNPPTPPTLGNALSPIMLPLTAAQISSLNFYYEMSSRLIALSTPSSSTYPLTDCAHAPPCLPLFRPSAWDGLSADTKETSGWCHVTQLPLQDWHQWGESLSFFPEYDPKVLAPLCESTAPPQILNPEHLVFLPPMSSAPILKYAKFSSFCDKKSFSYWKRIALQQWRPDKDCSVCTAPTRPFQLTQCPLRKTSERRKVVRLPCLCSLKITTAICFTGTTPQSAGMGIKLSLLFLGTLTGKEKRTWKSEDKFCLSGPTFSTTEIKLHWKCSTPPKPYSHQEKHIF